MMANNGSVRHVFLWSLPFQHDCLGWGSDGGGGGEGVDVRVCGRDCPPPPLPPTTKTATTTTPSTTTDTIQ